jgi:hypothetical protein
MNTGFICDEGSQSQTRRYVCRERIRLIKVQRCLSAPYKQRVFTTSQGTKEERGAWTVGPFGSPLQERVAPGEPDEHALICREMPEKHTHFSTHVLQLLQISPSLVVLQFLAFHRISSLLKQRLTSRRANAPLLQDKRYPFTPRPRPSLRLT